MDYELLLALGYDYLVDFRGCKCITVHHDNQIDLRASGGKNLRGIHEGICKS